VSETTIGTMSGTSLDGIDVALVETDGERIVALGPHRVREYSAAERDLLRRALDAAVPLEDRDARPPALAEAERMITAVHAQTINAFLAENRIAPSRIGIVGFHGQTVLHRPDKRLTIQIGDGRTLARMTGLPVVYDFRAADMTAGGQGAPFVPAYHRALVQKAGIADPLVVVNIGGVANVTYLHGDAEPIAFDTGPGNAPIDDLVHARTGAPMDRGGALASRGTADEAAVKRALAHSFFDRAPPKSLDRADFAKFDGAGRSLADDVATVTAITAASIARAAAHFPLPPKSWIVSGGGARNPELLRLLARYAAPAEVKTADQMGWNADAIEAQAFAFLAVRSKKGLPLSFPKTTGVPKPVTGGVLAKP
jgi:anhydro-N-acetylmuramic acid kinase